MTDLSIAQRLFNKRIRHSAATQQEEIERRMADIENEFSHEALLLDDSKALEIADDMIDNMEPETMKQILRGAIIDRPAGSQIMRQFVYIELANSRRRIAERRAAEQIEESKPEDYLPE